MNFEKLYFTCSIVGSNEENFGYKRADLPRGKIYYSYDPFSYESFWSIMLGDLCTRSTYTDLRTKIHRDFVGGLSSFWEYLDSKYRSDSHIGFKK